MRSVKKRNKIRIVWEMHAAPQNIIRGQGPSIPKTPENLAMLKQQVDQANQQFPNSHRIEDAF